MTTKKKEVEQEITFLDRPISVRVLGKVFFLNFIPKNDLSDDGIFGHCNMSKQVINIHDGLTPAEEADTVLHEVIHAIDETIGTELTEHQVHHIASGLFGIFQDNPELAAYLAENKAERYIKEKLEW